MNTPIQPSIQIRETKHPNQIIETQIKEASNTTTKHPNQTTETQIKEAPNTSKYSNKRAYDQNRNHT